MVERCGCEFGHWKSDYAKRPKAAVRCRTARGGPLGYLTATCMSCGNTGLVLKALVPYTDLQPLDLALTVRRRDREVN
jgi:hypothetical protein